jgi:hypothetical protein
VGNPLTGKQILDATIRGAGDGASPTLHRAPPSALQMSINSMKKTAQEGEGGMSVFFHTACQAALDHPARRGTKSHPRSPRVRGVVRRANHSLLYQGVRLTTPHNRLEPDQISHSSRHLIPLYRGRRAPKLIQYPYQPRASNLRCSKPRPAPTPATELRLSLRLRLRLQTPAR